MSDTTDDSTDWNGLYDDCISVYDRRAHQLLDGALVQCLVLVPWFLLQQLQLCLLSTLMCSMCKTDLFGLWCLHQHPVYHQHDLNRFYRMLQLQYYVMESKWNKLLSDYMQI